MFLHIVVAYAPHGVSLSTGDSVVAPSLYRCVFTPLEGIAPTYRWMAHKFYSELVHLLKLIVSPPSISSKRSEMTLLLG